LRYDAPKHEWKDTTSDMEPRAKN